MISMIPGNDFMPDCSSEKHENNLHRICMQISERSMCMFFLFVFVFLFIYIHSSFETMHNALIKVTLLAPENTTTLALLSLV